MHTLGAALDCICAALASQGEGDHGGVEGARLVSLLDTGGGLDCMLGCIGHADADVGLSALAVLEMTTDELTVGETAAAAMRMRPLVHGARRAAASACPSGARVHSTSAMRRCAWATLAARSSGTRHGSRR